MPRLRSLSFVSVILVLAACGEEQSPTAPTTPSFAAAGDRVVNSAADPGNGVCNAAECTLREAINDPGSQRITFANGLTGPITLAAPGAGGGTLVIEKSLRINGPVGNITIRRKSTDPDFRIFRIGSGMNVSLSFLTVRNGKTDNPAGGSAIVNFGTLDMAHCTLSGNTTSNGAALSNRGGELTFNKSAVVDNVGGGILNRNGHAEINNSTVARNSGTGIASVGDLNTIKVAFSTVWRNTGGGVSEGGGSATLRTVKVLDNSAVLGGGIFVGFGSLILNQSIVSGNSATLGGGIANRSGGDLTIRNSTISDNSASQRGGGIFNDANTRADAILHATNSTISGNSAAVGGGLYNAGFTAVGDVTLLEITIAHNTASGAGGGIRQESDEAILGLRNSLVALNSGASGPDVSNSNEGSPIFARFSLIGDGSGSGITSSDGNQVGSHSSPINPKLGPLADNGGPTPTHALLSGSPAIDAAGSGDCTNTDQRGVGRPQGSACDIGSYEKE